MDIQKTRCKKPVTRVESHASAASLIESGEQRYIKAINNSNNNREKMDMYCRHLTLTRLNNDGYTVAMSQRYRCVSQFKFN